MTRIMILFFFDRIEFLFVICVTGWLHSHWAVLKYNLLLGIIICVAIT